MDDTGPLCVISMLAYLFRILAALAAPSPHSSHPVVRFAFFTTVTGFVLTKAASRACEAAAPPYQGQSHGSYSSQIGLARRTAGNRFWSHHAGVLTTIAIPPWISNIAGFLAFIATIAPALVNRTVIHGVINSVHLTETVTGISVDAAEATLCQTPSPHKKKLWFLRSPDRISSIPRRRRSPLPVSPQDNTASTAFSDASGPVSVEAAITPDNVVEFQDFGSPQHTSSPFRCRLQFVQLSDGLEGNVTEIDISCPRLVSLYPALMGMLPKTIMYVDDNGRLVRRPKARGVGIEQDTQWDTGEEIVRDGSIALIDMIAAVESKLTDPVDLMRQPLPDEHAGANVTLSNSPARWDGCTLLTENKLEAYALADHGYLRELSPPGPSDDSLSLFTEEENRRCGTWINGIAQFTDNDELGLELDAFGKKLEDMRRAMNGDAAPSPPTPASVPVLNIVDASPRSEPLPTEPGEEEHGRLYVGASRASTSGLHVPTPRSDFS
ncbi:hypothetical protein DXG03_000371 [Asterophora parasitica]|uniref:Uncharacterized protein n=1 Tax=Asterophora parasitica TaxID=117018 RepID=A0A9P7GEC0_9AGAR|nr:hypothetical protein DXG03_000371 [Asterophora parasitica]